MSREPIESKLLERLERLFQRESFGIEVLIKRETIGVPILAGFPSNEAYLKWLKRHRDQFMEIQSARAELAREFKFPFQYSQWIEAYLLLGKNFKEFDTSVPFKIGYSRGHDKVGMACALEFDKWDECVKIQILPGASHRNIVKFIREHKDEIQKFLSTFERRVEPTRKKRKAERDAMIYACFKKGWLTQYGLISKDIDFMVVPEEIRKIDADYRKKVIGEQIKMRK